MKAYDTFTEDAVNGLARTAVKIYGNSAERNDPGAA